MTPTRRLILAAALAAAPVVIAPAGAQTAWPTRPINVIVPFAAGSATDTVARLYAEAMGPAIGATFVVENRAGANGMIGANAVAKAQPDGYTLLVGTNSTNAAAPALFKDVPFDHQKDFAPISFLASVPLIVGVPATSEIKTLKDLIAAAKAKEGKMTFATASSSQRVSTEMLAAMTGVKLTPVSYRSSPQAVGDMIAGRVELFTADLAVMLPHVQSGAVRALAVTSAQRAAQAPDVPTVDEAAGINGYELIAWFGAFAPAGTPAPVIAKLNEAAVKASANPTLQDRLGRTMGMSVRASTPQELADNVRSETVKWAKAVADAGIERQ